MPASEEHEMDDILSDAEFEADEDTGLTSKERRKHLPEQRERAQLDARIAGVTGTIKEQSRLADRYVIKRLLINSILVGLWYLFSLSISIVGQPSKPFTAQANFTQSSILGCSRISPRDSDFTIHCSRLRSTWFSNSPCQH